MPTYAVSPTKIDDFAPMRPASCPNRNAKGIPTNCTSTTAPIMTVRSMPMDSPYSVAIRMIVPMPSL